ncbi:uncharacterized protein LOC114523506 [Dendronephthya gigantea]|uniref:uncharacterized protein LOC114523506 n=1 Tax=Dendronephthya gigantea TaxID=151771 RepID=UPI00106A3B73|nr:uncharacterized protein LOC114523506 [Dendronephthya gigantea]
MAENALEINLPKMLVATPVVKSSLEQERLSTTSSGYKKNNKGLHTVYELTFQGLPCSRSLPYRADTSDHLPTGWPFERTHYSSTFTPKQYSKYNIQPASVHRKNNPHPMVFDPWKHPDMRYQIWKTRTNHLDTIRETQSAPGTIRNKGRRSWTTTYDVSFAGKNFDTLPKIIPSYTNKKGPNEWNNANAPTKPPPLYMMSMYEHDYVADRGRPSTLQRPWDKSFQNLNM